MSEPEPESELNMQSWLKDSKRKKGREMEEKKKRKILGGRKYE